jgi:hypothetical protein
MPNRWPIASGNWSNAAIWSGSIIPTASDDVFANSQSIYIDTNITVQSLRNSATGSAIAGGSFYLNNNVTASTTAAIGLVSAVSNVAVVYISSSNSARINTTMGATTGHRIQMNDSSSLTVSGSVFGGNTSGQYGIVHASTGNLFITGNLLAGSTNTTQLAVYMSSSGGTYIQGNVTGSVGNCLSNIGSGPIFINGNVLGGGFSGGTAIVNSGTGNITIYGNIVPNINCTVLSNTGTGNLFISGNISAGQSTAGIGNSSTGNITVIGNITGSSAVSLPQPGISNTSTGIIQVTGSIVGARAAGISTTGDLYITGSVYGGVAASGISTTAARTYIINGPIYAGSGSNGVSSTSTTAINIFTGPFYNTGSYNAVYAYRMQVFNQPTRWTFDTEVAGVQKTLTTIDAMPGVPSGSNVRRGVAYGFVGNLTGSLNMPSPVSVKQGEPVDNTTGTAIISPQDIFNELTQNITTPGSIGELLTRASTVQTVGSTISTFRI